MKMLFLMDPLENIVYEKDTTFVLMLGAVKKGHEVYYLPNNGLSYSNGEVRFKATPVTLQDDKEKPFITGEETLLFEKDVDVVFVRTDPPFDAEYLENTWILSHLPKHILVINGPEGIRTVSEKIWAAQFKDLVPETLISSNLHELQAFIAEESVVIAKPTDQFGGTAVFKLKSGDTNTRVALETLTNQGRKKIILQRYVDDALVGDKRIILLNGEPLGAILRVHSEEDHRNNFFQGGRPVATDLTDRDLEIIEVLKPHLKQLGLYFVGVDVIGDYLIEVNVTSPTCLQEMNRLNNVHLEDQVIDFVEELVAKVNC